MNKEARTSETQCSRDRPLGSVTHRMVEELGTAIVTRKFSSRTGFPNESEICEKYGASRSVVREAIKVLNAKGLLSARPRRGTSVRPEKEWNLLDPDVLFWMLKRRFSLPLLKDFTRARLAIEPAAAAEAARTASNGQIDNIARQLDRMREAVMGKQDPLETDVDFHLAILEASNNPFFYSLRPMIETALRFSIRFTNAQLQQRVASIEEHGRIYRAIEKRKVVSAAAETRGHLERALEIMEES